MIIMGLVMFNAFLTVYAPFFSSSSLANEAIPLDDSNMTDYSVTSGPVSILGKIFSFGDTWAGLIGGVLISLIGIGVALATKNYIYIGVTLFLGLVIGTYIQMSSVLYVIAAGVNDEYGIIQSILVITGIAIGLLIAFNVVDMFAPSPTR